MINIRKVVELALLHEGRGEVSGQNDGPYVQWALKESAQLAWCAAWIMSIHEAAGCPIAQLGGGDPRLLPFWECRRVATLHAELGKRWCVLGEGDTVQPGDLRIQLGSRVRHGGGSGHVDLVTEVLRPPGRRPEVLCVGGNVGNKVARSRHLLWAPDVTAYARPSRMRGLG